MKLYLDTANDDFVLACFDNNLKLVYKEILVKYQKKVELIPQSIEKMLKELKLSINDFNEFYTNLGPGFFTGVRISLVYLRTIATCLNKKIFTISTMQIIAKQNQNLKKIYINARGNKYYLYNVSKVFDPSLLTCEIGIKEKYDEVNYDEFLSNFASYLPLFKSYEKLDEIEPYYIKMPQIGDIK